MEPPSPPVRDATTCPLYGHYLFTRRARAAGLQAALPDIPPTTGCADMGGARNRGPRRLPGYGAGPEPGPPRRLPADRGAGPGSQGLKIMIVLDDAEVSRI